MRATVYRHLRTQGGLLGVSPVAWMPIVIIAFVGMEMDRPNQGVLVAAAVYALVRMAGTGRPDGFAWHLLMWRKRQRESGGRLCASARGRGPRFPFADYEFRDVRRRGARRGEGTS